MKMVRIVVSVMVDDSISVREVKLALRQKLGTTPEQREYEKGTLPDPRTKRRGLIRWDLCQVKQDRRG